MKPRASKEFDSGYVVVSRRENFTHWLAWRLWLAREGGRRFFPDVMTVHGEWPPQTMQAAELVAECCRATQRSAKVPVRFTDPPQPWDRWSLNETLDIERRHREDFDWLPPLPESRIGVLTKAALNPMDEWTRELVAEHKRQNPEPIPRGKLNEILQIWRARKAKQSGAGDPVERESAAPVPPRKLSLEAAAALLAKRKELVQRFEFGRAPEDRP